MIARSTARRGVGYIEPRAQRCTLEASDMGMQGYQVQQVIFTDPQRLKEIFEPLCVVIKFEDEEGVQYSSFVR